MVVDTVITELKMSLSATKMYKGKVSTIFEYNKRKIIVYLRCNNF